MTNIPPNMNVMGSIIQSQTASKEAAKTDRARRGQQSQEARQIKRMAEQQQEEVENTEQTDEVIIRREGEQEKDGQQARDEYRYSQQNMPGKIYSESIDPEPSADEDAPNSTDSTSDSQPGTHIDFSA